MPGTVDRQQPRIKRLLRWWRLPLWLAEIGTGAKSFADNPLIGSRRLNAAGLHVGRVRLAHALARQRRRRLARHLPVDLRAQFDRDGYLRIDNFLPQEVFAKLQSALLERQLRTREHVQGDTVTRRAAVEPALREDVPELDALLDHPLWNAAMAYAASTASKPFYYVQSIMGGVREGPPDPQTQLHSDTFHPSMKAWLFLTDVSPDGRPLVYVPGSHRLTSQRLAWERSRSVEVLEQGDYLSRRGSLRISADELAELGLGPPIAFAVPANTLVVIDTCGFHARAAADQPTARAEIWAYCRRTPFLPWTGGDLLSAGPIADRRASLFAAALDWLDRYGLAKQQWANAGRKRLLDPV